MNTIQNELIRVTVAAKGAELQHLIDMTTGLDYMWGADPQVWAKKSPVLFPVVGTLKDNTYYYEGRPYQLNRHGFARDKEFVLNKATDDRLDFVLRSDEDSLEVYPFAFAFHVIYRIKENSVSVTYKVVNDGDGPLYFSVGGHPAFRVPIFDGDVYDDYILKFNADETAGRWPISAEGLIEKAPAPFLDQENEIPLKKELFHKDAIVLKNMQSDTVQLVSKRNGRGLHFHFPGFPYLGIWAAKNADFVCIEPWCGIADSVDADQQLVHKEGIQSLSPGDIFSSTWTVVLT